MTLRSGPETAADVTAKPDDRTMTRKPFRFVPTHGARARARETAEYARARVRVDGLRLRTHRVADQRASN